MFRVISWKECGSSERAGVSPAFFSKNTTNAEGEVFGKPGSFV